jgi:hypothetical protein
MISMARFGTRDLNGAKTFYDGIAELLGAVRAYDRPDLVAYKTAEGGMLLIGIPFEGMQRRAMAIRSASRRTAGHRSMRSMPARSNWAASARASPAFAAMIPTVSTAPISVIWTATR